jgi:hypothetical protein
MPSFNCIDSDVFDDIENFPRYSKNSPFYQRYNIEQMKKTNDSNEKDKKKFVILSASAVFLFFFWSLI